MSAKLTPVELQPPWWDGLVKEKAELDARLQKLVDFVERKEFAELAKDEQARIRQQAKVMLEYSMILDERIRAYG